jgi:class 3 adenylate cyclase
MPSKRSDPKEIHFDAPDALAAADYGYGDDSATNVATTNVAINDYGYNTDESIPRAPVAARATRFGRRASTGLLGSSCHSVASVGSSSKRKGRPHNNSYGTASDLLDVSSSSHPNNNESVRMLRRGSMSSSKQESERRLSQDLAAVSEYKDSSGGGGNNKLQMLKDRFGQTKTMKVKQQPPRRMQARRSSISSYASQTSTAAASIDPSKLASSVLNHNVPSDLSIDLSHQFSENTAIVNNTNVVVVDHAKQQQQRNNHTNTKAEQIVESIVWFSFHTPRTVMEDLIQHEMDIWRHGQRKHHRAAQIAEKAKGAATTTTTLSYYLSRNDQHDDSDDDDDDDDDKSALSSLSDDGTAATLYDGISFSEAMMRMQRKATNNMLKIPKFIRRESALLFVDMSGFTKLSTMLDVEAFAKVINSYFDMIVSEVILHGGDILKFAGDAFFAEWKVLKDNDDKKKNDSGGGSSNPLADLNASLASINEMGWDEDDDIPKIATCVLSAAKCGASIVSKFSDYQVSTSNNASEAMLNVHCGVGVGPLVGLHVSDHKEDTEEDGVELRREFLVLGSAIDQVSFVL